MGEKGKPAKDGTRGRELRSAAEEKLAQTPLRKTTEKTAETMLHELQVHEIELEMQNEELKRTRLALEESRDKYLDLYEFAPIGYFTLTRAGHVEEVNLAGAALLGVGRAKLVRRSLGRFVAPEDLARWDQHLVSVLQSADKQTCELTLKREDGCTFFARLESIRVDRPAQEARDGDPSPVIRVALSNVTDRRRAETLLRSRLHLSELAQHASMDEVMQAALDEAERRTGSSIGFFHFVSEDQENIWLQAWSSNTLRNMCQAEGKGLHYPISQAGVWVDCFHARAPVIHNDYASLSHKKGLPDGHAPIVRDLAVPILRRGTVVAILGVGNKATDYTQDDVAVLQTLAPPVMDVVAVKQAEDLRHQAHERMKDIVRWAPAFMCTLRGREHVFEMCNEQYVQIVGRRNILNLPIREALPELDSQGFFGLLDGVFETGQPYSGKEVAVRLQRTQGKPLEERYVDFVYMPLREGDGSISGVFVHGVDSTEQVLARRRIEQLAQETGRAAVELEQRVKERTADLSRTVETLELEVTRRSVAERALRERSEQLRALASELTLAEQRERQRLAQVLHDGLQQLLVGARYRLGVLERADDPAARQLAVEVSDLISDSIETSRSLTAELSPPILHAGGLVPALEWLARWIQEKQGLAVHLEAQDRVGSIAEDVTVLLFQATRELLFNVAKHAGVKSARVQVSRVDGRVQITVADQGAGFDPAQLRAAGGPSEGFGLFSVRERLDLLGGRMEIDSAPGRGSRFTLVAPVPAPAGQEAPVERPPKVSVVIAPPQAAAATDEGRSRVVLVDDHIVMRQGLSTLLREQPDMTVVGEASDGESAVRLVRQVRPDVVLMDVSLPGMDGIEATRIICAETPDVRVIGLSMFEEAEQERAMRAAGAVSSLTKSGPALAVLAAIRACARPSARRAKMRDKKPQARTPARRGSRLAPKAGARRKPARVRRRR